MSLPLFRLFACAGLTLLFLAGCSRRDEAPSAPPQTDAQPAIAADQKPVQGDWVVEQIPAEPDTLNPVTGQDDTGQTIMYPDIFESMLFLDNYSPTVKFDPLLAESYDISPDQLTYTFHLRHGVKWHDGEPFTADDVKYTYDRIQDPKVVEAAPTRSYLTNIKSCEVLDPYTIRFTATERYFKTLEVLGTYIMVVPKHIFEKGNPDFAKHPACRAPVGTGPYKFVRWDTGERIVLERNDDYWGGPIVYPKRLVYEVITEPYVARQLLKKGEIDVVDGMSPLQWERELAGTPSASRLHEIVYPYPAYSYLGFNLRLPVFSDIRVRHAIDLLIPRDEIMAKIYLNKYAGKCSGYDPPSTANYNQDVQPTPNDPDLAMSLLTEAGWKNDHGDGILYKDGKPLSFTLMYRSGNPDGEKAVELIQEALKAKGIDLQLSRMEVTQMYDKAGNWNFDAVMGGWGLDMNGDPTQLWSGAEADKKKSSNFIGYKNPEADKLIAAGKLEYDADKRAVIYRQLHKMIHDDYPCCFLFNPHVILLVSDRFQNVKIFAPRPCFDITTWWTPLDRQQYRN